MEGEADGLPTFVSSAVAQRSPLPSPSHAPTQLRDNIAGTYQMGDKAELPTQLLGDDDFYEKETQDMNHEENPFGDPAEDFQETQLLDEYDDSGGRSTPSRYKYEGKDNNEVEPINRPVNYVNSDSSTEDEGGEEDLNEMENQRGGDFTPSVARHPPLQTSKEGPQDIISSVLLVEEDETTRVEVGLASALHKDMTGIPSEERKSECSEGDRAEANMNALEKQEVEAIKHSPTQVPNNIVSGVNSGDVTGGPQILKKLPSVSFGSIGSIRGESMRATAACPLTWKPSCDVALLGYGFEEQETRSSLGNALQRVEEGEIPVTNMTANQTVLETGSTGVNLPNSEIEDPQTHKPLKPESPNLGNSSEMTLSDAVAITPNNQEGKREPPRVEEGVTTSLPECVHEQLCIQQDSPEPHWITKTNAVEPPTLRVFERRKSVSKDSNLPPGSKHQEQIMQAGVPGNKKNEVGEDDELGLERRARQLFPDIEAEKEKTKFHHAVYEGVSTRPTLEKDDPRMEDNLPLVPTDNLDLRISPRSKLVHSSSQSMSYLDSQEPGEDIQARALDVVDKLVWLNNPDIPELPVLPGVERDTLPPKAPSSTASKALAQVAESHVPRYPLGVYEWVDSQHDEAGPTFGGVKEIETSAARPSLGSETGTREGNKGGHKVLADLGWQQHEGMGKLAKSLQEKESLKFQRAQPLEPPKAVKERRASHGLRLVESGKSQGGVDEIKSDSSTLQNMKTKLSLANRHLFEDEKTSQHGMSNVGKEEEDGQTEQLVKAVRPDTLLDLEALQNPGVEAVGEDTGQCMQIATRSIRKKRPEASEESDESNMRLQKRTAGRRVSWRDDVVKDKLTSTTKRKVSQKTPGGVCDKGEEKERAVSDNDTLESLHKAIKRPKLQLAGEENKSKRKRNCTKFERESEDPISGMVNRAQKRTRLLKTENLELVGSGIEDRWLVGTSAKGVLTRRKKQLMNKTQGPVKTSSGRRDQQIKKGSEATITVKRAGKQESPTEFKREGTKTSLSAPVINNAKSRASGTGVGNSPCEPEEVTTLVENPSPAVATQRMTQVTPHATEAFRTAKKGQQIEKQQQDFTLTAISNCSKQNSQTVTEQDAPRSAERISGEQLVESKRKGRTASFSRPVGSGREVRVAGTGAGSIPGNLSEVTDISGTPDSAVNASSTARQSQSASIIMQLPITPPSSEQGNHVSTISIVQGGRSDSVVAERREDLSTGVMTHEKARQLQDTVEPSVDLPALTQSTRVAQSGGGESANRIKRGRGGKKSDGITPAQLTTRKEWADSSSSGDKKIILGALHSSTSSSPKSTPSYIPLTTGKRRRKKAGSVHVLFSHGLDEVTVKHQCKILAKLGGHAVNTSGDCTHFITEKFQRTGNMLEAMAAGKPVVTPTWLDSCAQANFFLDEKKFYLEDGKKEKELGFSMYSTISSAQQRPLLQGCRVFITPSTNPKPPALKALVKAAGGEVEDKFKGPSLKDAGENQCVVIADEKDYNICIPFLEQGAKVCRPELIFSGILTHHLDYTKYTNSSKTMAVEGEDETGTRSPSPLVIVSV